MRRRPLPLVVLAAGVAWLMVQSPALQAAGQDDPAATRHVITLLLASAGSLIPATSSCAGSYGQKGPAKIADLLATELAYLQKGENAIGGSCTLGGSEVCTLTIHHANGEDLSSAEIRFHVVRGKLSAPSLNCVITP